MSDLVQAVNSAVPGARQKPFLAWHPLDRNFYLGICLAMWAGVGLGFGSDIVRHVTTNARPYPPIVHVHAAVFASWLLLVTGQVLLIRLGRRDIHRTLGYAMLIVAAAMLIVGPLTAYISDGERIDVKGFHPTIVFVQLTDMVAFATVGLAGVLKRADASAHKRLMLLSTIYITDAGFTRIPRIWAIARPSDALGAWAHLYYGPALLVLGMGIYDLITRRRLHPAYVIVTLWFLALQIASTILLIDPRLGPVARTLLGHNGG